ncbi:hypothetical protein GCM10010172_85560 [Paractinoplanes ferrugineus]|uniref:WXG100 family type VII secretion target n=1 Tax=Paractinoplanes ferrugineus TaxID=113564 RepID=A0A919J5N1_9ACTN|nr:hypothetical protein [Actinoplanes ferrugineus]GIE15296.1 hypothetical protein Afe05nite_71360 [Actinoplanes ferrugineus]
MVSDGATGYDVSKVRIDVELYYMHQYASVYMPSLITSLQEDWKKIGDIWDQLKISWVGEGSEAADAFNARLKDVQNRLFGTPDKADPTKVETPGILDRIRYGAVVAAANYNAAEHAVTNMFDDFVHAIAGEGDGNGPQDSTTPPITVDYNTNPFPTPKKDG